MTKKRKIIIAAVITAVIATALSVSSQSKAGSLEGWYCNEQKDSGLYTKEYLHFHDGYCDIYQVDPTDGGKIKSVMTAHTCKKADVIGLYETAYDILFDKNETQVIHNALKHTISVTSKKDPKSGLKYTVYIKIKDVPEFRKTDLTDDTPSAGY